MRDAGEEERGHRLSAGRSTVSNCAAPPEPRLEGS